MAYWPLLRSMPLFLVKKLSSLENELTKEALAKLKDKALLIQESLQDERLSHTEP